jgi:serine/threonine-protein kinase
VDGDRNLLFGVLALQAELIDAGQFIEACTAWAARKDRPLADLLLERGWITPVDRGDVERLLDRKLRRHGDDPAASLAAVADDEVRRVLAVLDDPELRGTITRVIDQGGHVLLSTLDHVPETRERYTLTRLHARGGIGQVWLARDAAIGREVALKELRPERAADGSIWSRFLEEARITGQLEHPSIVPVYELASAGDDRPPFYTMRFVRGRTLSEAIRHYHAKRKESRVTPLDLAALLNAFVGVCNAVAYAHARGVIHRDLKGQNVVLGDFGEVIVLDWGLAKLVGVTDEAAQPVEVSHDEDREATRAGQVLGTPAYMPPEQAEGRLDRVDRRSDIYSLGAILYEILVGRPPYTGADTAEVIRRAIEARPIPPRREIAEVAAALEAICLKAMAREPDDRYASATDLADEVRRYLADEPVSAFREPLARRLGRWARRHRTAVAAAAALVLTALPLVTIAAFWINGERIRADRGYRAAREAVDRYFTEVSESRLLDVPGLQPLRKSLLEGAREFYERFARESKGDPTLAPEVARSLELLGRITLQTGSRAEGAALLDRAAAAWRDVTRRPGARIEHRLAFLSLLDRQTGILLELSRPGKAEEANREASRLLDTVVADRGGDGVAGEAEGRHRIVTGMVHEARSRHAEAIAAYRAALDRLESNVPPDDRVVEHGLRIGVALTSLGRLLRTTGAIDEAESALRHAVERFEAESARRPGMLELTDMRTQAALELADHFDRTDQLDRAEPVLRDAIERQARLVSENPAAATYQETLARAHAQLGRVLLVTRREEEAATEYQAAEGILESLSRTYADEPKFVNERAALLHGRADLEFPRSPARAEGLYRRALELREGLVSRHGHSLLYRRNLADTQAALGFTLNTLGRYADAESAFDGAIAAQEAIRRDIPEAGEVPEARGKERLGRAIARHAQGRPEDARDDYAAALAFFAECRRAAVPSVSYRAQEARSIANLGLILKETGRFDEALRTYDQLPTDLPEGGPARIQDREYLRAVRDAHWGRATLLDTLGRGAEARPAWDAAAALAAGTPEEGIMKLGRASSLARGGDHAAAAESLEAMFAGRTPPSLLLYDTACVNALCSRAAAQDESLPPDERTRRAEAFARAAMDLLGRARASGFFRDPRQRANFAVDPDFEPLRGREEFDSLAAEIARQGG